MSERITAGQLYPNVSAVPGVRKQQAARPAGSTFHQALNEQLLKISHHAEERLRQRGIQLQPEQLQKINHAIDKAAGKGAKDSLLLMGDTALIVNITNRTVVTAMNGETMKDNIFTQIDSAMIIS